MMIRVDSESICPPSKAVKQEPGIQLGECPYRGLAAFLEQDAPFFFGRTKFIEKLQNALKEQALVVVVGSSGSGKSSLINAGLLPFLRQSGDWLTVHIRPAQQPFNHLVAGLLALLDPEISETDRLIEAQKLAEALSAGEISLLAIIERILEKNPTVKHVLLFGDQFEELYSLCSDVLEQQRFISVLLETAISIQELPSIPLRILLNLRADFMGVALNFRPFADVIQGAIQVLGLMSRSELEMAVKKPAEMQGANFEPGLVERILRDVGEQPGNLPLLEFALTQLWSQSTATGLLTHAAYEQIGRVEGALTCYAEIVFSDLRTQDQISARHVFMQLIQPGHGTEDTRRVTKRDEIGEMNWHLVQHLAGLRLVTTNRDPDGNETVEIIHEALIQQWVRLKDWLESDRAFRIWQETLRASIRLWQSANCDQGGFLRGVPLDQAEIWLAERCQVLSEVEKNYIQRSIASREDLREESLRLQQEELENTRRLAATERRSRRFLGILVIVLTLAVIVAAGLIAFANQQRSEALRAYSLSLAADAERALSSLDIETALSLALAANRIPNSPSHTKRVLLDAAYSPGAREMTPLTNFLPDFKGSITSIDISPLGDDLLMGLSDGQLVLWKLGTDQVKVWSGHKGRINSVAFSPDALRALSGGDDHQVIYWDISQGKEILHLGNGSFGHTGAVRCVDISYDGRFALSGGASGNEITNPGELFLWDLQNGQKVRDFQGHINIVVVSHFTPDDRMVLSSSGDMELLIENRREEGKTTNNDLILWDTESGEILNRYTGLDHDISNLTISSDGSQALLTSFYDNVITILNLESGEVIGELIAHQNAVRAVIYLPGEIQAVSASDDASLIIWDLMSQQPIAVLKAGTNSQNALSLLADGRSAISITRNGEIFKWDLQDAALLKQIGHHEDAIFDVDFSPDGKTVLSCAGAGSPNMPARDSSLRLWDVETGDLLQIMEPQVLVNWDCAISPDGRWALSGAYDGSVRLWNLANGEQIREFRGHSDWVTSLEFSPDGKNALTGSKDGWLIYWDLESGESIHHMFSSPNSNWALAISPDGSRAISDCSEGGNIYWDLENGLEIRRLERIDAMPGASGLAFLPDGSSAISGENDGTVIQWDLETGKEIRRFGKHDDLRTRVQISPDGEFMLTSGMNGVLRLWDLHSGELVREFGYTGLAIVFDIALSPDGRTAISGSNDQRITVWEVKNPSLEELLNWIEANRYVPELSCEEKDIYQIEPLCP